MEDPFIINKEEFIMKCPVCTMTDLLMTERMGVEIDYCPQCRGVWLDRGELDKIIERSGPQPATAQQPIPQQPMAPQPAIRQPIPQQQFPQQPAMPQQGYPQQYYDKHHDDHHDDHHGGHHEGHKKKGYTHYLKEMFDF